MFIFIAQLSIAKCCLVKKQNVHFEYVSGGKLLDLFKLKTQYLVSISLYSSIWNLKFHAVDGNSELVSLQQALPKLSIWT